MSGRSQARRLTLVLAVLPLAALALASLTAPAATAAGVASGFGRVASLFGGLWQGLFVAVAVVAGLLACSPLGRARLGTGEPLYGFPGWVAVLLCTLLAGGGVFWVVAEPLFHFQTPPPHLPSAATPREAAVNALAQAHLHWGFLAWAMVGTLGAVSLAASHHLDGAALRPQALLEPVLGRVSPTVGAAADAVAIVAVVAGTVGPIGFLALQLSNAAEALLGVPDTYGTQAVVLAALVALYAASAASGLQRGITWLSRANVVGALVLGAAVFAVGPTSFVVDVGLASLARFGAALPSLAFPDADPAWNAWWTVFFWGWFLGFAPMMSVFVARISRGRTVRELVLAVMVLAPLATHLWFAVLGGSALGLEIDAPGTLTGPLKASGMAAAMLALLQALPGAVFLVPLFLVLVFCFLATTGDSVAFAVAVVVSGEEEPPVAQRVAWAVGMGVLAAVLLGVGQTGIDTLQQFIVLTAAPVTLLVLPTVVTGPRAALRLLRHEERAPR